MNQIDFIILGIIAAFLFVGYIKGLVRSILSLIQYVVVIFFAFQLNDAVSKLLIKQFELDGAILNWLYNQFGLVENNLYLLNEEMVQMFVARIINVIAFVVVFVILKIFFWILMTILNRVVKLPILNEVNKLGGMVLGGVEGILIVYILITLINWLPLPSLDSIKELLATSFIGNKINYYVPVITNEIVNQVDIKGVTEFGNA